MGEPVMELGNRELEKIGEYVKAHIHEWISEVQRIHEIDLVERIVRLDERFDAMQREMDGRFSHVEERFEFVQTQFAALQKQMDERFNAVDRRFTSLQWFMGVGFTLLAALMGIFNFF